MEENVKSIRMSFNGQTLIVQRTTYPNGMISIQLFNLEGMPFAKATIDSLPELPSKGCAFVKNYAENNGILEALEEAGLVKPTGNKMSVGYVEADEVEVLF